MESSSTNALRAFRILFRPIAHILLRAGVNWKDLLEIGKATYVEVATSAFGVRGRPTNVSRVAILTGFTRREVRRLRELLKQNIPKALDRMNYATRVLSGWFQDDEYTDESGKPSPLSASGSTPSFESLCYRYCSDVPATTMLKELKHVGAVVEGSDGRYIAKSRVYIPVLMDPEQMLRSGSVIEDIGGTIAYNLHRSETDPSRFERRATNTRVAPDAVPAFRQFIEHEGQDFLERVDAWLTEHEQTEAVETEGVRLGIGAYWIEQPMNQRSSS